ncbi:MAG TPA: tetratricopeptide repeat protein [bacterium]|nr:tetratricopeptide repeat protein [bacterium]HPP88374.1 tetratricopeptide repeat protein [bacterium]
MQKNKIKITREDLKRNELIEFFKRIKTYFQEKNEKLKPIIIGGLVAAIIVVIVWISIKKKIEEANERYTNALYKYTNSIFQGSPSYDHIIGELQGAYNTFTKTNLAKIMILNIADAYYRNKDYPNALTHYDKFLKANNNPTFAALAKYGKSLVFIEQQDFGSAINLLKELAADNTAEFIRPEILIQSAIVYSKLKDDENAKKSLEEIINNPELENSSWKIYASYLMILLQQKKNLPEINYNLATSSADNISDTTDILNFFDTKTVK